MSPACSLQLVKCGWDFQFRRASCWYQKCVAFGCELGSSPSACREEVNVVHWYCPLALQVVTGQLGLLNVLCRRLCRV